MVVAEATQGLASQASSVASSAEAYAAVPVGVVAFQPGVTSLAGSGALSGTATSSLRAEAVTVGDDSAADHALAFANGLQPLSPAAIVTAGLDLGNGATSIGASAQLLGSAALSATAVSTAVQGDSSAGASGSLTTGINLGNQTLNSGDNAAIKALADVALFAKAVAATGDANASIADPNGSATVGLGSAINSSTLAIGKAGLIDAVAKDSGTATAITVTGSTNASDYAADAVSKRSFVEAISLFGGTLSTGDALALQAAASSTQTATALSSGTADGTSSGEGSRARAAEANFIIGVNKATLDVGGNLSSLASSASLNSTAAANSVAGNSRTESANTALVTGANLIVLKVGNDAPSGLIFSGSADTAAIASSTSGWASVESQGANVGGIYGDVSSPTNSIQIGDDAGLISGSATNSITARANSTQTSPAPGGTPPGSAAAQSYSYTSTNTYGILNTEIAVGGDGTVQGKATTTINSLANIITANDANWSAALSKAEIRSGGISLPNAQSIQIGDLGNVLAQVSSGLTSTASSVNSAATASGTTPTESLVQLAQSGLEMSIPTPLGGGSVDPGQIAIGRIGSISAESLIGKIADPSQAVVAPLVSKATSVSDAVDSRLLNSSTSGLTAHGIGGSYGGSPTAGFTSLYAGPAGGSITGRSRIAADVNATNVGELGNASIDANALAGSATNLAGGAGISQMNLYAGSKGNNQIKGESAADINLTSTSTNGDTSSTGFIASAGITKADPLVSSPPPVNATAAVSGLMQGISQLSGSSLAQTVRGVAQSDLSALNLGISGYDISMSANGGLTSIASIQTSSNSISVGGSV
jgi:hypothetical protein